MQHPSSMDAQDEEFLIGGGESSEFQPQYGLGAFGQQGERDLFSDTSSVFQRVGTFVTMPMGALPPTLVPASPQPAEITISSEWLDHDFNGSLVSAQEKTKALEGEMEEEEESERPQPVTPEQAVVELLYDYEFICQNKLAQLTSDVRTAEDLFSENEEVEWMRAECNLWRLIAIATEEHLNAEEQRGRLFSGEFDSIDRFAKSQPWRVSHALVLQKLLASDPTYRWNKAVMEWLEQVALRALDQSPADENGMMGAEGIAKATRDSRMRLNTKAAIDAQTDPTNNGRMSNVLFTARKKRDVAEVVSELDPDAPTRSGKHWHAEDEEEEARFLRELWTHIRSGQIVKAQTMCRESGQSWRSAAIAGVELWHDANLCGQSLGENQPSVGGNRLRNLWIKTCLTLAQDESAPKIERAIFGSLIGHLESTLLACSTWEDCAWAFFRCATLSKEHRALNAFFDPTSGDIQAHEIPLSEVEKLPGALSHASLNLSREILDFLERPSVPGWVPDSAARGAAKETRRLFRSVILRSFNELSAVLSVFAGVNLQATSLRSIRHALRFGSHALLLSHLFPDQLPNPDHPQETRSAVIERYCDHLIQSQQGYLIAGFAKYIFPKDRSTMVYAKFLSSIEDERMRQPMLDLADEHGLDVFEITKRVVETVANDHTQPLALIQPAQSSSNVVAPQDQKRIKALEWHFLYPEDLQQRKEALLRSNSLLRTFMGENKPAAMDFLVKYLLHESPIDLGGIEDRNQDQEVKEGVRENVAWIKYVAARNSYENWVKHYETKPARPQTDLLSDAAASDRILRGYQESRYNTDMEKWIPEHQAKTDLAVQCLLDVLVFPGGWLVPESENPNANAGKWLQELHECRRIGLRQAFFSLLDIYQKTEDHAAIAELANILADEVTHVFEVLDETQRTTAFAAIKESSIELLAGDPSPF